MSAAGAGRCRLLCSTTWTVPASVLWACAAPRLQGRERDCSYVRLESCPLESEAREGGRRDRERCWLWPRPFSSAVAGEIYLTALLYEV